MEQFKYRYKKLIFVLVVKVQLLCLLAFYYFNRNEELFKIITKNRNFLKTINKFLPEVHYSQNDYGVQRRIYNDLEKEIVRVPTYSDFLIFLINKLFKKNINYLEIGVSVLKNYLQINNGISDSNIVGFDINEINPNFKNLNEVQKNNNNLMYFKGSVLNKNDAKVFNEFFVEKFDLIFSDALHEPEAIRSEFELIIKDNLKEEFLIYYDDLDFDGIEDELEKIRKDLENHIDQKINFYTLKIYGWIGQNEKLHKNGILTTYDLEDFLQLNNMKLYKFKTIN
tara:strand:+ start:1774 stop:2619 length:846 start_codon:yes stop_codon:yes gene_type:complete